RSHQDCFSEIPGVHQSVADDLVECRVTTNVFAAEGMLSLCDKAAFALLVRRDFLRAPVFLWTMPF
ncbi:MAG: hypothetical protein WC563_15875, partial [Brevundimonas sp.]